jgi:hypothetical protein
MELVITLLILSLLIGTFSQYMFAMFSKAERSMVKRTVININTALHYRASMMMMKGDYETLSILLKINPMKELQSNLEINDIQNKADMLSHALSGSIISTPSNYGGEIVSEYINSMEKGKWYFVIDNNVLIYKLNNSPLLYSNEDDGQDSIRFQIKFDYKDNNANGKYEQKYDEFNSIRLEEINR